MYDKNLWRLFWEGLEGIGAWDLEEQNREGSKAKPRVCDKLVITGENLNCRKLKSCRKLIECASALSTERKMVIYLPAPVTHWSRVSLISFSQSVVLGSAPSILPGTY